MRVARTIGIIVVFCALSSAVWAGGSKEASSSGPVTIHFWYLWAGQEAKDLQQVVSAFNSSQKKVIVKGLSVPDQQKQVAAMSAGSGAFDVTDTFNTDVAAYASKGVLASLDPYIKQSNYDLKDYVPAALATCQYQGKTYALPNGVFTVLLLYNKTLFSQAGIAGPPKTTQELLADMQKLTVVKNGQITQLGLYPYNYITMGYVFGGSWTNSQGQPTPTNPGIVAAYNFYIDNVVKKYGANQIQKFESGFGQYASPQNPFYVGKVAMTIDGSWQADFTKLYAPKLKWGAVALPYPDGKPELADTNYVTTSDFFIPTDSKHKQAAWEFLKFLESPDSMFQFTHAITNLPARESLIHSTKYEDIGVQPWIESLKSKNLNIMPSVPWIAQYLNDIGTENSNISLLKETPLQGLQKIATEAKQYAGG